MPDNTICDVFWLGRSDYAKTWHLQAEFAEEIAAGRHPATLLLLEHPHTYTVGRRGGLDHVVWDETERESRGIDLIEVDRGGDVTYHGPGQLVGYPLLQLAAPGWQGERLPQADFVGYLRRLEKILILTLMKYGIPAGQREGLSGVWVMAEAYGRCPHCDPRLKPEPGKIASIGVKVDAKGISRHGFALNVAPDMSYWEGIIPCGINGVQMVSMADLLWEAPGVEQVAYEVAKVFGEEFQLEIRWVSSDKGDLQK
jgi:lipoyl(octanoyl) transferase